MQLIKNIHEFSSHDSINSFLEGKPYIFLLSSFQDNKHVKIQEILPESMVKVCHLQSNIVDIWEAFDSFNDGTSFLLKKTNTPKVKSLFCAKEKLKHIKAKMEWQSDRIPVIKKSIEQRPLKLKEAHDLLDEAFDLINALLDNSEDKPADWTLEDFFEKFEILMGSEVQVKRNLLNQNASILNAKAQDLIDSLGRQEKLFSFVEKLQKAEVSLKNKLKNLSETHLNFSLDHIAKKYDKDNVTLFNLEEDDLLCPITKELMDSATTLSCGHSFSLESLKPHHKCPYCSKPFYQDEKVSDLLMDRIVSFYKGVQGTKELHPKLFTDPSVIESLQKTYTITTEELELISGEIISNEEEIDRFEKEMHRFEISTILEIKSLMEKAWAILSADDYELESRPILYTCEGFQSLYKAIQARQIQEEQTVIEVQDTVEQLWKEIQYKKDIISKVETEVIEELEQESKVPKVAQQAIFLGSLNFRIFHSFQQIFRNTTLLSSRSKIHKISHYAKNFFQLRFLRN